MKNELQIKHSLVAQVVETLTEDYDITVMPFAGNYRIQPNDLSCETFKLEIRTSGKGAYLRVWASAGATGQMTSSRYADFYEQCSTPEDWRHPSEVGKPLVPDTLVFTSAEVLFGLASELLDWAIMNVTNEPVVKSGTKFSDTNFAGYGERDFMAAAVQIQKSGYATIIPGVGTNLGFEFQVPSTGSRIDAVEFDAAGNVVTVIECQSGIQTGNYLDDEHFAKAISRYPQSEEICETVKKIVVIAGGFAPEQLATFAQLPYEIVALKTVVVDGKVALEVVA